MFLSFYILNGMIYFTKRSISDPNLPDKSPELADTRSDYICT